MANLSKVMICNMALAHCSVRDTIESLDEDSTEARACKMWYDHARLVTLEEYNWQFARRRQALAVDDDDAPTGWSYRYAYPASCVKAREIENPTIVHQALLLDIPRTLVRPDAIPFEIELSPDGERRTIITDLEDAVLIYTSNVETVLLFPRTFVDALSYSLAHYIAYRLTGKAQLKQLMYNEFQAALRLAAATDGNEAVAQPPRDADWIRGRY